MLRVQEICKQQGITMQDLAKRMGVTYQALYAAVSGNPTIGKLGEIANALNVHIADLLPMEQELDFIALIDYKGKLSKATTIKNLEKIIEQIKIESMNAEEKHFRTNLPYGLIYDTVNNKGLFFNRYYQHLGELTGIISIYNTELVDIDMSHLTEKEQRNIFQTINNEVNFKIGFFYSDATNPYNSSDSKKRKELKTLYEGRISKLSQIIDIYSLGY